MSQGYDHTFAQAAPAATKSQIQEGYDVNLLRATHPAAPPPKMEYNSFDAEGRGTVPPPRAIPWWQTKKGIAIIAVAVVVVLAAVIGGAVGGTAGKKSNNGALELPPQSNQTATTASTTPSRDHKTVEVLTTTLFDGPENNITVLTLSATIEMFQTDNPTESLHVPHPVTTTVTILEEIQGDSGQPVNQTVTSTVIVEFPPVTEGAKPLASISSIFAPTTSKSTRGGGGGGGGAPPTTATPASSENPAPATPACQAGAPNCSPGSPQSPITTNTGGQ